MSAPASAATGTAGLRVRVDHDGTLGRRIAAAHGLGVPFVAVVGAAEVAAGTVALRGRERQEGLGLDAAITALVERCAPPA